MYYNIIMFIKIPGVGLLMLLFCFFVHERVDASAEPKAILLPTAADKWTEHIEACRRQLALEVDFTGAMNEASAAVAAASDKSFEPDRRVSVALMLEGICQAASTSQKSQLQKNWGDYSKKLWKDLVDRMPWGNGKPKEDEIANQQAAQLLLREYIEAGEKLNRAQMALVRAQKIAVGAAGDQQINDKMLAKLIAVHRINIWTNANQPAQVLAAQQYLLSLEPDADAQRVSAAYVLTEVVILNFPDAGIFVLERWKCGLSVENRKWLIKWLGFLDGYADQFKLGEFADLGAILKKNESLLPAPDSDVVPSPVKGDSQ